MKIHYMENSFINGQPNIMVVNSDGRRFIVHSMEEAQRYNSKTKPEAVQAEQKEPEPSKPSKKGK